MSTTTPAGHHALGCFGKDQGERKAHHEKSPCSCLVKPLQGQSGICFCIGMPWSWNPSFPPRRMPITGRAVLQPAKAENTGPKQFAAKAMCHIWFGIKAVFIFYTDPHINFPRYFAFF